MTVYHILVEIANLIPMGMGYIFISTDFIDSLMIFTPISLTARPFKIDWNIHKLFHYTVRPATKVVYLYLKKYEQNPDFLHFLPKVIL